MSRRPFLATERFELGKLDAGDLGDLVHLPEGEGMGRFLGPARAEAFAQFALLARASAGGWTTCLRRAGFVRQHCWGQGVASQVMRAALRWFDEIHGRRRIACMIEEGNTASERLAAGLGFVQYGMHVPENDNRTVLKLFERA